MPQDSIFGYVPPAGAAKFGPQALIGETQLTGGFLTGDTTPPPAAPSYTPPATNPGSAVKISPLASAAYGGVQAGAPAAQAYDTKSGVISTLGAAAGGAAAGAVVGGPVGALVGGGLGLLTGGLNAYLAVGKANKTKRDQKRLLQEAEAKQAARDKIARDDAISQLAYDRTQVNLQKKWAKSLQVREAIKGLVDDGTVERDRYVKTGRI